MNKEKQKSSTYAEATTDKEDKLVVRGARTHNLKDITVEMPRNKMIVFTGLSGSGKSSLAFDTIFAEGQRRYVESLSSYARQFLRQMQKPDVDEITGLSPAISIDQKSRSNNPRSTVATITEIYDYLRVLFARIGHPHCLICGQEIKRLSIEEIKNIVLSKVKDKRKKISKNTNVIPFPHYIEIFAPMVRGRKGEYYQLLYDLLGKGYSEVVVDGIRKKLREQIILSKTKRHDIDVLVDQISLQDFTEDPKASQQRLYESVEKAIQESDGLIRFSFLDSRKSNLDIESPKKRKHQNNIYLKTRLDLDIECPSDDSYLMSAKFACPHDGFSFPEVEPRLFSFNSPYGACEACHGLGVVDLNWEYERGEGWQRVGENCPTCKGARLRPEALNVLVGDKNIVQVTAMSISAVSEYFNKLKISSLERDIAKIVIKEIESRLQFMINVGIEYLSLDRRANTLSGGEAQRIRLASQLGSGLVGALYVLDEPTIGLHCRDNDRLIKTLHELRNLGNTIIVVEHDEDTIYSSDYIVDIGRGAGIHGGEIVVSGSLESLLTAKRNISKSSTLAYLRGEEKIEVPRERRIENRGTLQVRGGNIFNIKNLSIDVLLGRFIAITGVSGSGKSSFMYEILFKNLQARFEKRHRSAQIFNCASFIGTEYLGRAILIDQSAIGRTPRSNPATYTGSWTFIRELFAQTSEARARGWKANRFSFNVKGGRCEACQGNGQIAVEMHFLPTVYVPCDVCHGKRFMKETLEIEYKKKNIHQILKMTVEEALKFFEDIPAIYDRLKTMERVGLSYLELGQSATTLSGGEAQRVKISSELYRPHLQKTIYLLDEPTIGLHYDDVKRLIAILQELVNHGNTVVVIEHNMDFIKSCDYVIDFGPEGGDGGGKLIGAGTPEYIANVADSYTGKYLKKVLKK